MLDRSRRICTLWAAALALTSSYFPASSAQNLTDAQIQVVVNNLAAGAQHSWELGTREQALIELNTPTYSVLNKTKLPPSLNAPSSLNTVLDIAATVVANRTKATSGKTGPQPLVANDGSAADPASNGVAVLIANLTGHSNSSINFGQAATDQINYLFTQVPKTSDGALSHRTEQVQLWSDFMYMVPPFIAYYGVVTQNRSMVEEAYTQVKLYRNYLRDSSKNNIWKHIVMGENPDPGHWSTGNGWAAGGMLRVLGTIQNSQYANSMKNEQKDLTNWIKEIQDGMYQFLRFDNLFFNYADDDSTFVDASSTALMAATVYRMALMTNTHTHLPDAEASRKALSSPASGQNNAASNSSIPLANMAHFTDDGWLTPVANPDNFGSQGTQSPEGQAFVVEMHAAWRDWVANGSPGANAASHGKGTPPSKIALSILSAVVGALTSGWFGSSTAATDE